MLQEYEALAAYPESTRGTIPWGAVSKATWEEGPPSQVRPEGVVLVLQVNTLALRGHLTCCCFLLDPAHAVLLSNLRAVLWATVRVGALNKWALGAATP